MNLRLSFKRLLLVGLLLASASLFYLVLSQSTPASASALRVTLAQDDDDDEGAPVGGVQTGGEGTASSGASLLPYIIGGAALFAVGGLALKRRPAAR